MKRAKTDTEIRIVEAAVQLFARRGFKGTRTRDIARLADVSEACLFRYFARKQDLFWAALESRMVRLKMHDQLRLGLTNCRQPEEVLPLIFEMLVHTMVNQPELMPLLYFANVEMRRGAERICRQKVGPVISAITHYITVSVKQGHLRPADPSIAAMAFLGSVLAHQRFLPLFTGTAAPYRSSEQAVTAYSNFWVDLLVVKIGAAAH